jgi:hypothetical protein
VLRREFLRQALAPALGCRAIGRAVSHGVALLAAAASRGVAQGTQGAREGLCAAERSAAWRVR